MNGKCPWALPQGGVRFVQVHFSISSIAHGGDLFSLGRELRRGRRHADDGGPETVQSGQERNQSGIISRQDRT